MRRTASLEIDSSKKIRLCRLQPVQQEVARDLRSEIGFATRLGRRVVVLEPGWEIEGVARAATPAEAVNVALADLG
jgi:hypothetical protein